MASLRVPRSSLTRKACGSVRTANGWRPSARTPRAILDPMPTTIFLFEAESGQLRVRSRFPTCRPIGTIMLHQLPLHRWPSTRKAACSRWPPPRAFPFSQFPRAHRWSPRPCRSWTGHPPGNPLGCWDGRQPGLHDAHRPSLRPGDKPSIRGRPSVGRIRFPERFVHRRLIVATKVVEQVVLSWDVTLPRTRIEDYRHEGIVRAIKLDPRDRSVTTAGDDRMIREWDRGGPSLVGRLSRGGKPVLPYRLDA